MQFAQDALQEQKETLERTVKERLAEIDQHRRNAISIAEDAEAARQAAEASRAQYEQVVSMISDIVWRYEVDDRGQVVDCYISPVGDRLLGLPAGTIGNDMERYFSYVDPEDLPTVQQALSSAMHKLAKEVTLEYRLRKPDGATLWVRSRGSAYLQPDGHVVAVGTTSDVTERKQAEESLLLKNLLLSTQQEVSIDGILAVGGDDRVILFNRRFVEMMNIPPELLESKDDATVLRSVYALVADPDAFLNKVKYLYAHCRETSRDELSLKDGRVFDRYSAHVRIRRSLLWPGLVLPRHHGAEANGRRTPQGQRRRRGRQPRQEPVPGQHEPRDPHADDGHPRLCRPHVGRERRTHEHENTSP